MKKGQPSPAVSSDPPYTVFISHAGEDKSTIAMPLRERLRERGIKAFVDEADMIRGTDALRAMKHAMETARVAVFVLSPEFVARKWPMKELMFFLARRKQCFADGQHPPLIIPFFYRLSIPELYDEPRLDRLDTNGYKLYETTRFFARQYKGELEADVFKIKSALTALHRFMGIENTLDANNDASYRMTVKRDMLGHEICDRICQAIYGSETTRDVSAVAPDVNPASTITAAQTDRSQYQVNRTILEKALRDGQSARLDTVRLMVLGAPSRGKTSTIASLRRIPFDHRRKSTQGIDLSIHYIPVGEHSHSLSDAQIKRLGKASKFQAKYQEYQQSQSQNLVAHKETIQSDPHSSGTPETDAVPESQSNDPVPDEVIDIASKETEQSDVSVPKCIILRCWDFGGQSEYEVAHELFISPRSIVMFVLDLPLFESMESRFEEVTRLQLWIQTIYAATPENELDDTFKSILIVGTKKEKCEIRDGVLFGKLRVMLSAKLDSKITEQWKMKNIKMIAIENQTALENIHGSGLSELEMHLEVTAKEIIGRGAKVPLRWLAFAERLRLRFGDAEWESFSMNQYDAEEISTGLQFSSERWNGVNVELYNCLIYLRNLGEVVLFEVSDHSLGQDNGAYILFPKPEMILQALKRVVAPEDERCKDLSDCKDIEKIRMGILTRTALQEKWGELPGLFSEEERNKLLSLMMSMDIFITLKSNGEHGVPSLLQETSWETLRWLDNNNNSEREVHALTMFEGFIPFGFVGTFIGRLHRTIGNKQTDIRLIRRNAVLLTPRGVQHETEDFQIFVGFKHDKRELHWKVRGRMWNFDLVGKCLSEFEAHNRERLIGRAAVASHYILASCPQKDCDTRFGLKFKVPFDHKEGRPLWGKGYTGLGTVPESFDRVICDNISCSKRTTLSEAIESAEASERPSALRSPIRAAFDVFISHAGPDKYTMAYPLYEKLKKQGITAFLDQEELTIGDKAAPKMEQAMNEAPILVAITSPEFCVREWPIRELSTFIERGKNRFKSDSSPSWMSRIVNLLIGLTKGNEESQVPSAGHCGGPVIIPLFYRLDVAKCRYFELTELQVDDKYDKKRLKDLMNGKDYNAVNNIKQCMSYLAEITGVENKEGVCNDDTDEKREMMLNKVVYAVRQRLEV